MASDDRFYLLEFRNRPVLKGDISSLLKIDGLVVGGGGTQAVLLLPSATDTIDENTPVHQLSTEEWSDFIKRADQPEILMGEPKVFVRKARWEISGAVQQKIWKADGVQCMYCGKLMGDVQLTIDHFIPLELGGANNQTNYLSACRRCNKDKGSSHPKDYLQKHKYEILRDYLVQRVIK